jgi:hypothetical protein
MNGFHDDARMARETDARERGEIRREQDARWAEAAAASRTATPEQVNARAAFVRRLDALARDTFGAAAYARRVAEGWP